MVKTPRLIPDAVRAAQARASDPKSSAFVSANAGSGKTHVLVQRVIRLLLEGVAPEKILCVTFTKAAAANMAERVFSTLGHWVTLDDAALDKAIVEVGIGKPSARLRTTARKLFACALETPGGLKVQTIHALCARLLQQFPFEANVPARFSVLDERDQNEMMERANLRVLLDASRDPESATGKALNIAMASAADVTFKEVVREACLSRDHFMAWADAAEAPIWRSGNCPPHSAFPSLSASRISSRQLWTAPIFHDRGGRKSPSASIPATTPIGNKRTDCETP
jgi:ATP-dependent helicase/nuclease subunit A